MGCHGLLDHLRLATGETDLMHRFTQVDVFTAIACLGNALAVVHDADDLTDDQMAAFARWTNLSETTFLLRPTTAAADYRVRIWTTTGELPFAGHPTLGSAAAWLAAGGISSGTDVVQECGVGLVTVRRGERLAFAAPPLLRGGPVDAADRQRVLDGLRLDPSRVLAMEWVDNGPKWIGVEVDSAQTVLAVSPDPARCRDLKVGVLGRYAASAAAALGADVEVRAFYADGADFAEDPVTGSLNAGMAQWLIGAGRLPGSYVARQGTVLRRDGRVFINQIGADIWIGGDTVAVVTGTLALETASL